MSKMSLFALSAMAMVLSCSEKGPFDYPSLRDLEDMAAMSSSSEGGSSPSTGEQSSSSEEVASSSSSEAESSSSAGEQSSSSVEVSLSSSEEGSSSSAEEQSSSSAEATSSSSEAESSSSTEEQSSSSVEVSSSSLSGCGNYNEENEFCHNNQTYDKCGDKDGIGKSQYDPIYYFCRNNYLFAKCGGKEYNPPDEVCNGGVVGKLCGSTWFNPETHFCLSGTTPTPLCGEEEYTGSQFCRSGVVYNKCNGNEYEPTHFCSGNTILAKCGGAVEYNPGTEQCCGSGKYIVANQFCHTDNTVHNKCGNSDYNPSTHYCHNGTTYTCNNQPYNPSTHYCHNGTTYTCNNQPYNPTTHFCDTRDYKSYRYKEIGSQTWMAENLNYEASGSKCGNGSSLNDANTSTCDTYGRLYNWSTAMNGSASSTDNPSGIRGVCPNDWHLPSDAEWGTLIRFVNPNCSTDCVDVGAKLKSTGGWNDYNGVSGNGTDEFGFSALPGGYGDSGGNFYIVGNKSFWWSSSGYGSTAYCRYIQHDSGYAYWTACIKPDLLSVRCLRDY